MKKPFCDVCGKPAFEAHKFNAVVRQNVGQPQIIGDVHHSPPWAGLNSVKTIQPKVRAWVGFDLENQPKGATIVDLCPDCAIQLVDDLRRELVLKKHELERNAEQETPR